MHTVFNELENEILSWINPIPFIAIHCAALHFVGLSWFSIEPNGSANLWMASQEYKFAILTTIQMEATFFALFTMA